MCIYLYIYTQLLREEEIGLSITDHKISTSFELGGVLFLQLVFCFGLVSFQVFCFMDLSSHFIHSSACWTLDPGLGFAVSTQICKKLTQKMLNTNRGPFVVHSRDTQENMFSPLRHCNPGYTLFPTASEFNHGDLILTSWKCIWWAFFPLYVS